MKTDFDTASYGQRWQVETVFSMIKRKLGYTIHGKTQQSQNREMALLALTFNLMIILSCQKAFLQSNKKLIVLCLALAVVAWSLPAYADSFFIGTNFYNGQWYNWDQYVNNGYSDAGISPPCNIKGTTYTISGSFLGVSPPSGWGHQLALHIDTTTDLQAFMSGDIFAIDTIYDSGSWSTSTTYAQMYMLSIRYGYYNSSTDNGSVTLDVGGAGAQVGENGVVFLDTLDPGYPGGLPLVNVGVPGTVYTGTWEWLYAGGVSSNTFLSNMTSFLDSHGVNSANGYKNGYMDFIFAFISDPGTFYVGNARIIPEPTTIALLGLGGLALLRKRRM
jgi:hypothetical protein